MGLLNGEEAFSTVVYQFLNGGTACASERLIDIHDDRLALYRHIMPQYAPPARWLEHKEYMPENLLTTFDHPENNLEPYSILTLAKWDDESVEKTFSLSDIPGLKGQDTAVFEFKEQKFYGILKSEEEIKVKLPPHACRLFRLTHFTGNKPVFVGTDLNLSKGMEIGIWDITDTSASCSINTRWNCPVNITIAVPDKIKPCNIKRIKITPDQKEFVPLHKN